MKHTQCPGFIGVTTLVAAAALTSFATFAATPLPQYQVLDIGTLGGDSASAVDINDSGQVTGSAQTANGSSHAFIYSAGEMLDLGLLKADRYGAGYSNGADINNKGEVVGVSDTGDGFSHAFRYVDGAIVDLGTLGGSYSSARSINEAGQIAGESSFTPGNSDYHGFLFASGAMTDLGSLGDSYSTGDRINAAGAVAGIYQLEFQSHAYLYSHGVMTDLVPGMLSYVSPTSVMVNAAGHVSGSFRTDATHSFLWRDGVALDLGNLGGGFSDAAAVNDADQVVGDSTVASGESHAYRWTAGDLKDLGTLGGTSSNATAINASGSVTGQSLTVDFEYHPFVYRDGALLDLGLPGNGVHGIGRAINAAGQVTGQYQVLTGDPFAPYIYRSFIATPISLLFTNLESKAGRSGPGRVIEGTVRLAERYYGRADLDGTCAVLGAVVLEAGLFAHDKRLAERMKTITVDTRAIKSAVGCDPQSSTAPPALSFARSGLSTAAKAQALAAYRERFGIDINGIMSTRAPK